MPLIPESEQRDILIYAFRYALGRMTYAPHTIVAILIEAWPKLSKGDRDLYKREIREAIDENRAGMDFDVKAWETILNLKEQP